jgi:NAD(P)H-nitrite reductase large subunit
MGPRYLLVGSGIASLAAAEALRQRDRAAAITMVSEEAHNFYSRPGLAYLLRGDLPEKQLYVRSRQDLRALGVRRIHARAQQLLCDRRLVVLADGHRLPYDRLLLATGALAVPPPFPGGDLAGVVKLDGLDDARRILKLAGKGRPAVVVGGGITALELAEGLAARGMQVHYFLRGKRYWADVLDETESHIVQKRLQQEGITLHMQTQVKQAHGNRGRLTAVETQAGKHFPCNVLAVAIGVRPRVDLARQAGLKIDRGIVVNQLLQTSQPNVFAAGDCAQVVDPQTGQATLDVLWSTALAQGRIAGANLAGAGQPYVKGISCNITMLGGLKVTILGTVGGARDGQRDEDVVAICRGDSESWRLLPQAWVHSDREDVNRVRLVIGERRLVGALVMGDQTWSRPLQRLIIGQADITPIRAVLIRNNPQALAFLADFYQRWEKRHIG